MTSTCVWPAVIVGLLVPMLAGSVAVAQQGLSAPLITPPGDVFDPAAWDGMVVISSEEADATIRVTLDDTEPTEESPVYEGPFIVSPDAHVTARAFKDNRAPSSVVTAVYGNTQGREPQSPLTLIVRGGTKVLRPLGSPVTFDKVAREAFTRLVGSVTGAATWHDPTDNPDEVLDVDGRLAGFINVDANAATNLLDTIEQIGRVLPDGWQLVEVWITDRALDDALKAYGPLSDGRRLSALVKVRPRHLNQVHFKFLHPEP
ncbi:MAG TPA: FN3 associated domain-containing protein [Vicinamibacterales bacterium]|jgi:hypothetical protein|nr:FN3 associated domain-containing protein [Vicinamibacterales bacterium]